MIRKTYVIDDEIECIMPKTIYDCTQKIINICTGESEMEIWNTINDKITIVPDHLADRIERVKTSRKELVGTADALGLRMITSQKCISAFEKYGYTLLCDKINVATFLLNE